MRCKLLRHNPDIPEFTGCTSDTLDVGLAFDGAIKRFKAVQACGWVGVQDVRGHDR